MRLGDVILFLAPWMSLSSTVLVFVAYLGSSRRALVTLTPIYTNTTNIQTISLGLFSSCVRNYGLQVNCTKIASGRYSLDDILPDATMRKIMRPPHRSVAISLGLSICFSILTLLIWFIADDIGMGKFNTPFQLFIAALETWIQVIPLLAFLFGLVPFLGAYMFIRKNCDDWHEFDKLREAKYLASPGSGFLLAWIGYGLLFTAMIILWMHAFMGVRHQQMGHASPLTAFKKLFFWFKSALDAATSDLN